MLSLALWQGDCSFWVGDLGKKVGEVCFYWGFGGGGGIGHIWGEEKKVYRSVRKMGGQWPGGFLTTEKTEHTERDKGRESRATSIAGGLRKTPKRGLLVEKHPFFF